MGNHTCKITPTHFLIFFILCISPCCFAQKNKFAPNVLSIQTGGGHGMLSVSTGYVIGKQQQHFFTMGYGFVPSNDAQKAQHIIHAEYIFWFLEPIQIHSQWNIAPLGIGGTISYFLGRQHEGLIAGFPKGYYWFRTDFSSRLFLGTRIDFLLANENKIGFSADVGRPLLYNVIHLRNPNLPFFYFMNISFAFYFTF